MIELAVILALIVANGVFAAAEIAILTVRKTRLEELADEGRAAALVLRALRADPESFLATVQIGITVVGAAAAAFGGASLAAPIADFLERLGLPAPAARDVALAAIVAIVSFLSLVLGELVPKSLALRYAERYALAVARPLALLAKLARPFVRLLTVCSNLILRLFGDSTSFSESRLSPEELQTLVEETASSGALHPKAGEMASRALAMPGLRVDAVMTPRGSVVGLRAGATRDEVLATLRASSHSRFPVHDGDVESARGYVLARDALLQIADGSAPDLPALLHEAPFVPESAEAVDVLRDIQAKRSAMAFVVDEQGGLAGIVTSEDLVEEIVGEILHEKERPPKLFEALGPGVWVVSGEAPIREVNRELHLELPDEGDYATLAGLVLERFARIPRPGERLELGDEGVRIEVVAATSRKVTALRVTKAEAGTTA